MSDIDNTTDDDKAVAYEAKTKEPLAEGHPVRLVRTTVDVSLEDDDEGYCLEDTVPANLTVADEYAVYLDEIRRATRGDQ